VLAFAAPDLRFPTPLRHPPLELLPPQEGIGEKVHSGTNVVARYIV
jgi:hypothetical protein